MKTRYWEYWKLLVKLPDGSDGCKWCEKRPAMGYPAAKAIEYVKPSADRRMSQLQHFCCSMCMAFANDRQARCDSWTINEALWLRDRGVCHDCGKKCSKKGWHVPDCRRWEAHHIIAVSDGGGESGPENYMTLCLNCHKARTKAWRAKKKARRVYEAALALVAGGPPS